MNRFERDQWKSFRAEMIERAGGQCERCAKSQVDGATMHVHHKEYIRGRMPWQYNYSQCEVLCAGCHAAEHGIIPPPTGWDYQGHTDLEDLIGTCDYCGTAIRYAFHINHESWEPLTVGTDCCDNLTGSELASNHMESVNRYKSRRVRFISSTRWQTTPNGCSIRKKRMDIEIQRAGAQHRLVINRTIGNKLYESPE